MSDAGKPPPETEKPVPVMESDLMARGTFPVDVTVMDLVTAVPIATSPNSTEEVLSVSPGEDVSVVEGFS